MSVVTYGACYFALIVIGRIVEFWIGMCEEGRDQMILCIPRA